MMKRIVHVVAHNGVEYDVPMTAEQADFFLKLAEYKSATEQEITFNELVAKKVDEELQHKFGQHN